MNLLVFNLKTNVDDDVLGFTTDWLNGLAENFDEVFVISMSVGRLAVAKNVTVFSVGKESGYSELRRAVMFYYLLIKLLRSEKIDFCFAHMMPLFAVMGWPFLRLCHIPIILWYSHAHVPWMLRVSILLVDCVVTASRSSFKLVTDKLRIIGHGISVERFHDLPDNFRQEKKFVLLSVGRVTPIKRLELLIELLTLLPEQHSDGRPITLSIVGDPQTMADKSYSKYLKELANEMGVASRVEFYPAYRFSEVHLAYHQGDLFINSSDHDSVDKTVLEAMSCGLPVVTSIIAFTEIFDLSYLSICSAPSGNAAALASKVSVLLNMSDVERKELGFRLRETVLRDHSLSAQCRRILVQFLDLRHKVDRK